ncbi:MAG: hypothetical protein ED555_12050 [Allomuricauda sp.]|nr:MAG: hypothetical protein ED555_12050 [Allomuricauda sp.]
MRSALLIILLVCSPTIVAQTTLYWSDLEGGISWKERIEKTAYPSFQEATFSDKLTSLEGKKVSLVGFLLVMGGGQSVYLLSKNPMASCFFCGNGGMETVSEISFAQPPSFAMDDLISVTGILRLNMNDPTRCYYLLDEAEAFGF